jgi:hypothetical protein
MQRSKKSSKWRFRGFAYSGTRRLRDPSRSCADWPDYRIRNSTRAGNRTASVVVVRRHRVKAAAKESSFWIIPPRRSETAVLYGRSRVARSAADSSPKRFASGGLRFEEAGEDCRFCDDRERLDRGVLRNGERRPPERATHFFRQLGDRCRRQVRLRRQEAGSQHDRRLRRVSDRGRAVAMRSLEDTSRLRWQGRIGCCRGCRGANPIASRAAFVRRSGAAAQRRRQMGIVEQRVIGSAAALDS